MHASTSDVAEYLPAAQAVHALAPASAPVFVIEPAAHASQSLASSEPSVAAYLPLTHAVHSLASDAVEYLPAAHTVQMVAPVVGPVFVM